MIEMILLNEKCIGDQHDESACVILKWVSNWDCIIFHLALVDHKPDHSINQCIVP
jgi:hypothetical protein